MVEQGGEGLSSPMM